MNQIFRVIWNHATQSWVAVSELTKAHKKASSSNTIKTFLGATALLFSLNGAEAALAISDVTSDGKVVSSGATASGNTAIAIGVSTVSGSGFGVAIGKNARAEKGGQSIAIGGGNNSGEGAVAKGSQSIAIGGNTIAEGDSSIAIGGDDVDEAVKATVTYTNPQNGASKTDTIKQAFQDLTGVDILNPRWTPTKAYNAATAIGMKAEAKELAVSMGTLARAQKVNSVALGSGALATLDNAIALGAGSKTDKQGTKQTQTTVQGITYKWAGGDKTSIGDVVSVGSAGFERQIKNVAAGEVSNVSTDAINGSQLYGVLSNLTTGAFLNYAGDDADGKDKSDTTVIKQSIAENRLDIRGGADKAALTNENIGVNNENGKLWVKLAKDLKGLNSTTVGGIVTNASGIDMSNKPITNLAAGTNSTDAVNKSQLDKVANNNIKLGGDSGTIDAQQLDKTGGLQFNVKGTNGLTTEASGTDVTVKLDDATKAAVDSIANKIENNKIKLSATNDSTSTDQQDLNKSGGIEFKVKGDNGLTASALGDTVTLKLDDATKAKVDSVDSKIGDNNISLGSDSGSTDTQALTNAGGMKFNIKGENGLTTTASGKDVTVKLDDTTKDKIDNAADKDLSNITDAGKKQIKDQVTWKAKATNSKADLDQDTKDSDDTAETIGADSILTLDAGKNLRLQRKGKEFTYGLESNLTGINSITGLANTLPVTKNDAVAPTTNQPAPTNVDGTKAASVNDILNAGWNLKENDTDKDFVKAYDTVNFVDGTGTTANVTVTENGAVSAVKFDVKKTTLTADADKGTVSAGNAGDSFATANDVANAINKAFWKVTGAEDGGEFAEGNTTTEEAVKAGDKVTFKAGKNIKLKQAGKDFTYSLNPVLSDITSIGGNGTTMTFKPEGVDLGGKKITNIAPGTDDKDAVNKSQLDTAVQEVAEKPLSFSGDNKEAGKFNRTLGTEVKVVGGADASKLSDNNIGVIGDKTDTLTVKLAKSLKGLSDVEVKDDAGNTTNITPNGITISQPEKDGKKPDNVSLTKDGLNNGGQNITNVAGNLPGAKKDTTAPTTSSEGPSATDLPNITNNAATVGDVLNTGWNLQNNGKAKDFVKPYDTVNFIDGEGTTAVVETKDNKVSTVKYDVKLGAGLKKDDKGNITVDAGNITNENGAPKVADADKDKVATAGNVADAINNSYWTASAEKDGKVIGKDDNIKPSGKVTFDAGKNIEIDHSTPNKFTFKTVDNPEFKTLDLNDGAGNKVNLAPTADGLKLGKGDKNEPANITNVTSGLKPYGDAKPDAKELVNLDTPNVSDNTAATVGDLRNMGWIVGTPENKYVDTVKNANKVDFKAGAGISVTGKTTGDIREITIAVKEGEVVKPNDDPANAGTGYVTGNKVATAIQKSGFVVGKQAEKLSAADFKNEDEKVNPDDQVRFADGNNTKVKLATKESVDKDGTKVTTTTVKVDVTGLPVQYTDKSGTPVTKVGDEYFTVDKDGNPTATKVDPKDLTTKIVNPAAKPNESGTPTTLGNVKSNLPSVNDADKNAKDVAGNPIAGKDNKSAPMTADDAADIVNNAGNNAATVSDVLNAGWNLQNNGRAKDFVKPYDTVNFVDGKGTKAVVETMPNGTISNVKFDVDTGAVTSNKDGSVSGPVTPEMQKALDDAKKALADATTPEAKKAAQDKVDAAQANIDNVGNPIATVQNIADAINNSGFTLTTSENGGKKLSGKDEIINPGKKVDLAAGKNMTVKQDAEGKVTYATADEVNFSSVQFGDNGPKINAAGDNINFGDKDGNPTKITGVKAGDISPISTDAVNGAQIYALSRGNVPNVENITVTNPDGSKTTYKDIVVDENGTPILKTYNVQGQKEIITNSVVEAVHNMNEQGIKFFHSNDGVNRPKVETANSFDSSASGKFATAIGKSSVAHGDNAVAMGNGSKVLGNDSIAIGTGNIVEANNSGAFGDPNVIKADATGSYAFGNNNVITTKNTFVLGNDVNNAGNSTSREGTVENSVYLGNKSTATAGDGSRTASLYNIKQDGTKGTSTTAGSVGTVTTATVGNMTYGGFQGAKANGVVSVGAAGDERRIQNVAAGEISSTSTDAINGSQLYSVAKGVGNRINNLQGQVNKLGNRMNAGMATSAAMANLLQPHKPGQSVATAGIGQHKNQSAVAVGYSRISDNGKYGVRFSMGANTQGEVTGGAAVGYFW
ncbi:ESPR-type extended signal peptide-containing protein [Haemophilus haemolyticus]|uniref:Adhesin n=1 Tax=Haemophilus haemolyticus TaxID=726 RepID=A0AAQ1YQI8_HAEHA|nr:ESPR-type extended signal peptide-containing protein [Haemophilus haemolyticus]TDN44523.1 hypothetical protein EGH31_0003 [Haemophilus haemolyticus]